MIEMIGTWFSPEQYVFWTRIECTAWTLADYVIVFSLLRTGDLARTITGSARHGISYAILFATVPFAVFIPVASRGSLIFVLELAVTIPHFCLILYVLFSDARVGIQALSRLLGEGEENAAGKPAAS
jgi:hypothetical protein